MLGRVKTRLAAALGDEEALQVYQLLVKHTQAISEAVKVDTYIFYSDFVEEQGWPSAYNHFVQQGTNLGERIAWAFEKVFTDAPEKAVIIGSDCLELTTAIIEQAFTDLETHDVVIGPAKDGGYYLLGLKQPRPELFKNIKWSTPSVRSQTISTCRQQQLTYSLLPELTDIDVAEDWIMAKETLYAR